jgi:D-beta-D-heptose 7-phosphate kinase / D-beta-D-heptose 1-phosphate adenosyltransferase
MANGVFDLLHEGHVSFLMQARSYCAWLVIAVNDDESVRRLKGPERPIEPLEVRMANVARFADRVLPFDGDVKKLYLRHIPGIILRGWDQKVDDVKFYRSKIIQLPRYGDFSTTKRLQDVTHPTGQ